MAQGALSSSPFTNQGANQYIYDVFLSFRGEDTRYGFTGHLYSALSRRGVFTFIDDNGLKKGEEITPSLSTTIQKSTMAIVIFSKNYASSTFCLDELVQILDCYTKGRMWIWPVFYDVDPSEVRHQRGNYGEELAKYEQGRFKDDKQKVQKWRSALRQAADFSGWHFKLGGEYEHQFIGKIIEEVSSKLKRPFLHIANYPVGLETRIQEVQSLIGDKCNNEVNVLGIHGMGGMGKSTLARAIFNLIADQFEAPCFLANVREKSTKYGLEHIQETILSELVGDRNIKLGDVHQGIPILKEILHRKKVLLILDDVDHKKQLEAFAGGFDWFGLGSIIIITTRDKHLLDIHDVKKLYEVKKLHDPEALELFRWNALKNKEANPSYLEIIKRAINYADNLPLVLETIGSNLFGKTLDEWESALEAYERIPNRNVQETLRVSYDGLEENEKKIFLDIACFFEGCSLRYVSNMLNGRGFQAKYGIIVLKEKSLIDIIGYDDDIVKMHSMIQLMGREEVRKQSALTEKRNRLWFHEDVIHVLEKNKESKVLSQLIFTGCKNIREIPDVSGFPNLTKLYVDDCTNLIAIHDSVGFLDKLLRFSAEGCTKLSIGPRGIMLPSLENLCLRDCNSLETFPEILGPMNKLNSVDLGGTAVKKLPLSMQNLDGLRVLNLNSCKMLENDELSHIIQMLPEFQFLYTLELRDSKLTILPACIEECRSLRILYLSGSKQLREIRGLPPKLFFLDTTNCTALEAKSTTLFSQKIDAPHFYSYTLPGHSIPEWFDLVCSGNSQRFWFRKEFPSIVLCAVIEVGDDIKPLYRMGFSLRLKINDDLIDHNFSRIESTVNTDHIFVVSNIFCQMNFHNESLRSENKWNYADVSFGTVGPPNSDSSDSGPFKGTGLYINKRFTRMEDVQFTNPYPPESTCDDFNSSSNRDTVVCENSNSNSLESA